MEKWVRERKIIGLERRKAKGCNLRSSPRMARGWWLPAGGVPRR